jgi:hypothetical protein
MLISCEKCKKMFEVNERHLTSTGVTAVCPVCEHKHRVKRVVIPYSMDGHSDDDTEPYELGEIPENQAKKDYVREDELSPDVELLETKHELEAIAKPAQGSLPHDDIKTSTQEGKGQQLYHFEERRRGIRGTILDRLVGVNFLYVLIAVIVIIGFLFYAIF